MGAAGGGGFPLMWRGSSGTFVWLGGIIRKTYELLVGIDVTKSTGPDEIIQDV